MKRGRLLTSVILTCLVCFGVFGGVWAANWRPKLGLDLAGGLSVVYQPTAGQSYTSSNLQTAAQIMTDRAESQGLGTPQIDVAGNTIQVQIPGVKNAQQALAVIGSTAQLFFRPVLCIAPPYTPPTHAKGTPAPPVQYAPASLTTCPASGSTPGSTWLFTSAGWSAGTAGSSDNYTAPDGGNPDPALAVYQTNTTANDNANVPVILDSSSTGYGSRLLLGPSAAGGTIVATASASVDTTEQWVVNVTLTGSGATKFNALASKYYHTLVANDLGATIQSAPIIDSTSFPSGVQITGGGPSGFTESQANDLADVLQYGTLPLKLTAQDISEVSATLGHSALVAGLSAGLLGLLLVMIYMVIYYRALGIVVIAGLLTTGILIFGLISILGNYNFTLDLASITGLVVSVGITVDSYVVYFERLKDEIRAGRTVRASVDRGFKRAFRTVVMADTVSFLGAACLYLLSIGEVKDFALWLGISTVIDVATAYFFTRPAVILLGRSRIATEARVIGIARGLQSPQATTPQGASA